jgi:hypothetical protein
MGRQAGQRTLATGHHHPLSPPMAKNFIGLFDFAQFFGIIPQPTRTISKISSIVKPTR